MTKLFSRTTFWSVHENRINTSHVDQRTLRLHVLAIIYPFFLFFWPTSQPHFRSQQGRVQNYKEGLTSSETCGWRLGGTNILRLENKEGFYGGKKSYDCKCIMCIMCNSLQKHFTITFFFFLRINNNCYLPRIIFNWLVLYLKIFHKNIKC